MCIQWRSKAEKRKENKKKKQKWGEKPEERLKSEIHLLYWIKFIAQKLYNSHYISCTIKPIGYIFVKFSTFSCSYRESQLYRCVNRSQKQWFLSQEFNYWAGLLKITGINLYSILEYLSQWNFVCLCSLQLCRRRMSNRALYSSVFSKKNFNVKHVKHATSYHQKLSVFSATL